ncbi:hypothetical protein CFC21_017328 [Triticum aestivum]|uniref:Transcription repressor n=2 Tax=Triticum aestivum TaxID=4565 RepID=A0A3B6AZJ7_WHEAT|nr:transcription repressor OFP13-like [Triticum aestivum]KAF7001719.1 hypothetical protein CFC21_017328 [Triticum aestivum]
MSPLHPPHLHFRKLKKRARAAIGSGSGSHRPATKARKGLAAILHKLRDVHRPPSSPPSPSPSPSTPHHRQLCYPPPPSTWPWPSCRHPRTSSFRARPEDAAAVVYRTANTVYDTPSEHFMRRPSLDEASCSGRNSFAVSVQAAVDREPEAEERKELRLRETAVVRGVRSERLFFEPAGAEFFSPTQAETLGKTEDITTDAAAEDEEATTVPAGKTEQKPADYSELKAGAVVVSMESEDPYGDFRASMAEMVAAHGLRDWEGLEELLAWYLKLNAKGVHGVIVGAFVDLLVGLATPPSPSLPSQSPSSSCITFEDYSSATFDDEEKC